MGMAIFTIGIAVTFIGNTLTIIMLIVTYTIVAFVFIIQLIIFIAIYRDFLIQYLLVTHIHLFGENVMVIVLGNTAVASSFSLHTWVFISCNLIDRTAFIGQDINSCHNHILVMEQKLKNQL